MYAALLEMSSWMGCEQFIVCGEDAAELLSGFEEKQSLSCLVAMGRSQEKATGQKALDAIEALLIKRNAGTLTIDELLSLDVTISLGGIKCACVEEGEDAGVKVRKKYPKAR
jgi:hypothetical protein